MGVETIEEVITCGEPFTLIFEFEENYVPYPIGDYSAKIQLRKDSPRGQVMNTWLDGDTEIVRDDNAGKLTFTMRPSTTAALNFKAGFIDCLLFQNSDVDGIRSGVVNVTLDRGVTDHG